MSGADFGAGQEVTLRLRVLATTDLHAHLFPFNYYANRSDASVGLARLAAPILQARAECPNILLFDNGDTFQGAPLGDAALSDLMADTQVHPMIAAMNGLAYDAATLGNHDFDYGIDALDRIIAAARHPIVSANVNRCGGAGPLVAPHVILERMMIDTSGGLRVLRIGVTGAVPPQTMQWGRTLLTGRVEIEPIVPAITREVARMRAAGADLIVVLAHSGLGHANAAPDDENVALALAGLDGVDAVVAGHTHRVFPEPGLSDVANAGAALVQPGFFGSHLGQIDLELRPHRPTTGAPIRWSAAQTQSRLHALEEGCDQGYRALRNRLYRRSAFRAEMASGHRLTRAYCARPLGRSDVALETFFSLLAPCAATQLVADAKRAAVAPIIAADPALARLPLLACTTPYKAGGRGGPEAYTDVPKGALMLRHAADLYPYSNGLALLRANGRQIRDWLERAVSAFRQITPGQDGPQALLDPDFASYNFDRLDGLCYQIDLSQPARTDAEGVVINPSAARIRDLCTLAGQPVADADVFLVVTNTYRAAGGGHFPAAATCEAVFISPAPVRDMLAGHIAGMQGMIAPRVRPGFAFAPLGGVRVIYETGPAATRHDNRAQELGLIPDGIGDRGFARYLLTL